PRPGPSGQHRCGHRDRQLPPLQVPLRRVGGGRDHESATMIAFTYADPSDAYELQLREEDAREVSPGWRQVVALSALEGHAQSARDGEGRLVALWGLDFTAL